MEGPWRHYAKSSQTGKYKEILYDLSQTVHNLPAMQNTQVLFLGREDPLKKGMATHSSILAWRIPWTEKPGGLQSMVRQRVGHDWVTFTFQTALVAHRSSLHTRSSHSSFLHPTQRVLFSPSSSTSRPKISPPGSCSGRPNNLTSSWCC